jgi:putative oxidoreductase
VLVRLVIGGGFAYHGYPKLFTAEGHASFLYIMQQMGAPMPQLTSWAVGALEFFGGVALLTGAFVVTTSTVLIIELALNLAIALAHGGFPPPLNPDQPLPGYASSLLYITGLLALALGGAGKCSLTRMVVPKPSD